MHGRLYYQRAEEIMIPSRMRQKPRWKRSKGGADKTGIIAQVETKVKKEKRVKRTVWDGHKKRSHFAVYKLHCIGILPCLLFHIASLVFSFRQKLRRQIDKKGKIVYLTIIVANLMGTSMDDTSHSQNKSP